MSNPLRCPALRPSDHRLRSAAIVAAATVIAALMPALSLFAQQAPAHLNPVVEKLAQGKVVYYCSTTDISLESAHELARADLDFVYIDMEHGPMNFESLRTFLNEMVDKESILKKGNAQPNVAVFARFAPYGREEAQWVVKQGLDVGLMGVIFNGTSTGKQALLDVQNMRYPQRKGSALMEPLGLRGVSLGALWYWGVPLDEYVQRADVWPLNPQGDLLAIMLIETEEGVKNINDILSVPGVGAVDIGPGDLSRSLGFPKDSPETEAATQTILKACLAHNVPCGTVVYTPSEVQRRIKEGFKILGVGHPGGISASMEALLHAGRAATETKASQGKEQ